MKPQRQGEDGFALVVLLVAIFILLLFLGIAAPRVSRDLQREKELESVHRGNEYIRAIQLFYRKNGHYPTSVDQLEKTNNIRFLRRKFEDPLTGKADWRIIHVGENKTTVKGLFGQPLSGIGTSLGGSSIGGTSTIGGTSSTIGGAAGGTSATSGTSTFGGTSTVSGTGAGSSTTGSSFSNGIGSQSATTFQGAGGPIMGIGSSASGDAIITLNEQADYGTWEFLYDPRIEQLKAKSSLFGGGVGASGGGSGIGSGTSTGSGFGSPGVSSPSSPTTPTSPTTPGTTPQ